MAMTIFSVIAMSLSDGWFSTGSKGTDLLIAVCLGLAAGAGVLFFLKWLEPRLAEGAKERLEETENQKVAKLKNEAAEKSKAQMHKSLVKKQESVGPVVAQKPEMDFFGNRIVRHDDAAPKRKVKEEFVEPTDRAPRAQPKRMTKAQRKKLSK